MFTGITTPGTVKTVKKDNVLRLTLDAVSGLKVGDSLAVNGVCLTVIAAEEEVQVEVVPETLEKTTLGSLQPGDRVNLEQPLHLGDPLGGHLVQGHVDGTGTVLEERNGKIWIQSPLVREMVPKGSVAVDGVSMTVVDVEKDRFSIAVVPHTKESTTLGRLQPGQRVNIETDMMGKYVRKHLKDI